MKLELGIQSYCFRNFIDNHKVTSLLEELGLSTIELCGLHLGKFERPAEFPNIVEIYRKAGIKIHSSGVNLLTGEEAADRIRFEFCRQAGAKFMSVNFRPQILDNNGSLRNIEKLAEEYDIKLAIHNHGGKHWLGNKEMLRYILGRTSSRIGLNLDTAWAIDAGEDPISMIQELKDRLYLVHLKDFTYSSLRKHQDVPVGSGILNLPNVLSTLDSIGYQGCLIAEYEGNPENPMPDLKSCIDEIQSVLSSRQQEVLV